MTRINFAQVELKLQMWCWSFPIISHHHVLSVLLWSVSVSCLHIQLCVGQSLKTQHRGGADVLLLLIPPPQDVFLMIRRHKTTIFTDAKESTTVYELKRIVEGILKRPPEDQRLYKVNQIFHKELPQIKLWENKSIYQFKLNLKIGKHV